MRVSILTLFPNLVEPYFSESLMLRGVEQGVVVPEIIDFRDFAVDRHRTCDDYSFGGGPGMVLKPEPLDAALGTVVSSGSLVISPSPSGIRFDQSVAERIAGEKHLVLICGRYEGVDQRVIDRYVDLELSIGDFVMSSGELAALVIVDTVARLLEGFIRSESLEQESFGDDLLEYPHYTRPAIHAGAPVPEVLRNGHHDQIERWRAMKRVEKTAAMRPDLLSRRQILKRKALSIQQMRKLAERRGTDE